MFQYPRENDFVVVSFEQDYRSSNLSNVMRKRQYWIKEGGALEDPLRRQRMRA